MRKIQVFGSFNWHWVKWKFNSSVTLARFQVLKSHTGPAATVLDSVDGEYLYCGRKFYWMVLSRHTWQTQRAQASKTSLAPKISTGHSIFSWSAPPSLFHSPLFYLLLSLHLWVRPRCLKTSWQHIFPLPLNGRWEEHTIPEVQGCESKSSCAYFNPACQLCILCHNGVVCVQ